MPCPNCQAEAGAAEFCPACLTTMPKPAPVEAAPGPALEAAAAPAPAPAAPRKDERRQMIVYGGLLMVAVSVGFSGAALYERMSHPPGADDACIKLCDQASDPRRWTDRDFQSQLEDHRCHCAPPRSEAPLRTPNGEAPPPLQALPHFNEDKAAGPLKLPPPGPGGPPPAGR